MNIARSGDHCRWSASVTVLLAVLFGTQVLVAQATPTGRNILFIAVDDLRNWVGYNSDYAGTVYTPHIDALAAESTRYLNAYTSVPQCTGSRTTIMLGQSPATHRITRASFGTGDSAYNAIYNNPELVSLPEVMSANGYYSAASGKVFSNPLPERWDEQGPTTLLAELFDGFDPQVDNTFLSASVTPANTLHPDQLVANWSSEFVARYNSSQPFFLAVGFYLPHIPWDVPQWAYDLYPIQDVVVHTPLAADMTDEPLAARALADAPIFAPPLTQYDLVQLAGRAAKYTQAYLASVSHTDAMVGQLLTALNNSPNATNTDVIFWSDNGFHLGEKFHWRKNTLWEQAARVPLLVRSTGNPGYPPRDVSEPVSLLDLAPTVLDLAGLPPFSQFEGVPLHDAANRGPVEIFFNNGRATLVNGFKIIDYDIHALPSITDMAAYWLEFDPGETNNLILPLLAAIMKCQARSTGCTTHVQ